MAVGVEGERAVQLTLQHGVKRANLLTNLDVQSATHRVVALFKLPADEVQVELRFRGTPMAPNLFEVAGGNHQLRGRYVTTLIRYPQAASAR